MTVRDIAGNILQVGDKVYYARKNPYHANGYLVDTEITSIQMDGNVKMGKLTSTSPDTQLVKQ